MKKYSELDREEFNKIEYEIDGNAALIEVLKDHNHKNDNYGLCNRCKSLSVTRTEYRVIRALCLSYEVPLLLKSNDPVTECSGFIDKFCMSLFDMQQIAYIIEPYKRPIGFVEPESKKKP